jgi:glucose/arabinose dehydrogenase
MGTILKKSLAGVTTVATTAALLAGAAGTPAGAAPPPKITTVITDLDSPRGLTFDRHGNLYVAESGTAGEGPIGLTQTGRVSKFQARSMDLLWTAQFSSLYEIQDPSQPTFVLGPEGLSSLGKGCRGRHDCPISMIMSMSRDGILAHTGGAIDAPELGLLYEIDRATGAATATAEVGNQQYAWTLENPNPLGPPDSNPFGVLVTRDEDSGRIRTFVADAGANTVVEVEPDGTTRVIAAIPNDPIAQATPTCVAQGPDGALYVATLSLVTNFVFGGGASSVWRIDPDADHPTPPQLWATGLTTVTACTFDRSGNFWATEMFGPTFTAPPFGDLVRISFNHPTRLKRLGGGGVLPMPGGIAQGPDGAMYVTVDTAGAESAGRVVRFADRANSGVSPGAAGGDPDGEPAGVGTWAAAAGPAAPVVGWRRHRRAGLR